MNAVSREKEEEEEERRKKRRSIREIRKEWPRPLGN